jgi:AraC-like DNA-binding protein
MRACSPARRETNRSTDYVTAARNPGILKIWRPEALESLELRLGTSFQQPYPRHWHEEFFISAITGGAGHFHYRGVSRIANPGTLVLVAPGEIHSHYDCNGGRSFRAIHIPWSFLIRTAADVSSREDALTALPSSMTTDATLFESFLDLHRVLESNGTRLHRESVLLDFFARLIRHVSKKDFQGPTTGRETFVVRRAREFLHEHYNREVSLKDLAAVANLSPYHFHRVFCQQTGMPPHAYQVLLRITLAKSFLRKRWPISQVASVTGFADQSHFTRHFKRLMGVTPGRYADPSKNVQDLLAQPQ